MISTCFEIWQLRPEDDSHEGKVEKGKRVTECVVSSLMGQHIIDCGLVGVIYSAG